MVGHPFEHPQKLPLISLRGITKTFGLIQANQAIDLDIYPSEVLALLGENGAGKSTLVKILYGFYQADSGTIEYNQKPVNIQSPNDARRLQIGMVFQTFNLIPAFTVAENIALFIPQLDSFLDLNGVSRRIQGLSERYNLQVDPNALVMDLSVGDQQKVEILKLLLSDARVLILDEPTRVLVPHEIEALFEVLNNLRQDGYAITLITHKMKEVFQIADRIAVLRSGRLAGTLPVSEANEKALIEMMFARPVAEFQEIQHPRVDPTAPPILELRGVCTRAVGTQVGLDGIDLKIHSGEIVGITGVSGNGQRELADVVLGRLPTTSGAIWVHAEDVTAASIREIRRKGIAFIPESPLATAVAPFLTVLENMAVPEIGRYARQGGFRLDWQSIEKDYSSSLERLDFSLPLHSLTRSLSGGNLQRMVIARELAHKPELIIASYLTSGLDVRSAIAARQALIQAREQGAAVLLFSDDLDELFSLSDRLIVIQGGRLRGQFTPADTNYQEIGFLMTGSEGNHVA